MLRAPIKLLTTEFLVLTNFNVDPSTVGIVNFCIINIFGVETLDSNLIKVLHSELFNLIL